MDWLEVLNTAMPTIISLLAIGLTAVGGWALSRLGLGTLVTQARLNELITKALQWAANRIPGVTLNQPVTATEALQLTALASDYIKQNAPATAAKFADTLDQKIEARIVLAKDEALP